MNLIEKIQHEIISPRSFKDMPVTIRGIANDAEVEWDTTDFEIKRKLKYWVGIKYGLTAWIDNDYNERSTSSNFNAIRQNLAKRFNEEVYGDFRILVLDLEKAVYDADYEEAKAIISRILGLMSIK